MKQLLIILSFGLSLFASAQEDNLVTLTVTGQGTNIEIATQRALRSAIEQTFGTFISSNTEIVNDELIKDEIVSVSSGNIQNFDVLSEASMPDGGYVVSLKAVVSISKLTSFAESKGIAVEFKGGLFASNILMQELYERNEQEALDNSIKVLKNIANTSFDYSINVDDPVSNNEVWNIPVSVDVHANANFPNLTSLLQETIKSISLTPDDRENYLKLNKQVYPITLITSTSTGIYFLRKEESISSIIDFIYSLNNSIVNFNIDNGLERFHLSKYYRTLELKDDNFRFILKYGNDGMWCGICRASLFNNFCGSGHDSERPNFNYRAVYGGEDRLDVYSIEFKDCFHEFISKKTVRLNQKGNRFVKVNSDFYLGDLLKSKRISNYPHGSKRVFTYDDPLGLVISFSAIDLNSSLVQFQFNDIRSLEEIKKITGFEVVKLD